MPYLRALALFAALSVAIPCAGQTPDLCAAAYGAKRWNDVLDACATDTQAAGHTASTTANLSTDDKMALYETVITKTLYMAQAYAALGDSRMAQVNVIKAGIWLKIAQEAGLSPDSAQYKSLMHGLEQAEAVASPSPPP